MISMISSVGKNMELGKDNKLIWKIPDDMKYFKNVTMGHKVIMGYKTYMSIPNKLLGREMIVLSTSKKIDGIEVIRSANEVLDRYLEIIEEVFIIGGASLYSQFIDYASKLYLTEIDAKYEAADAFFPNFNKNEWDREIIQLNEYNDLKFNMCVYTKKRVKNR